MSCSAKTPSHICNIKPCKKPSSIFLQIQQLDTLINTHHTLCIFVATVHAQSTMTIKKTDKKCRLNVSKPHTFYMNYNHVCYPSEKSWIYKSVYFLLKRELKDVPFLHERLNNYHTMKIYKSRCLSSTYR